MTQTAESRELSNLAREESGCQVAASRAGPASTMKLICLLIVAFMGAASAFAPSALVRSNAIGVRPAATVSMACRTNTKRDKFFRNLEVRATFRCRRLWQGVLESAARCAMSVH